MSDFSTEIYFYGQTPAVFFDQYNIPKDSFQANAGESMAVAKKAVHKKINENSRLLAMKTTAAIDEWPKVCQTVARQRHSILFFDSEMKKLPTVMKCIDKAKAAVQVITQKAERLEEMLTKLEVANAHRQHRRWRISQQAQLEELKSSRIERFEERKLSLQKEIRLRKQDFIQLDMAIKRGYSRRGQLQSGVANIESQIKKREEYYQSEDYQKLVREKEDRERAEKMKQAFDEAFQRDLEEYKASQQHHRQNVNEGEEELSLKEVGPGPEVQENLDEFLGHVSDEGEHKGEEEEEKEEEVEIKMDVLEVELDPEDDPDILK